MEFFDELMFLVLASSNLVVILVFRNDAYDFCF